MPRKSSVRPLEVSPGVWWVGNGGWGGTPRLSQPGDCNVYLVDGGDALALIDTGVGPEAPAILRNVERAGFAPDRISHVFLTHAHVDHSSAAAWLRGRTSARICAGSLTARALALPEPNLIGGLQPFSNFSPAALQVDRWLEDGDVVDVGAVRVRTLFTPGHTIDSCCYLARVARRRILFSGDTLIGNQPRADFKGRVFKGMLGWLDGHWSAPLTAYVASLRRLAGVRPGLTLPGHGIANNAAQTRDAVRAGIRNLNKIIKDPDLLIMFAIER